MRRPAWLTPPVLRWLLLMPGILLLLAGLVVPMPSYFERQAKIEEFNERIAGPKEKLKAFHATIKPGQVNRPVNVQRLDQLTREVDRVEQQFGPAVNAAVDRHRKRRLVGYLCAGLGVVLFGVAWTLTDHRHERRSEMMNLAFDARKEVDEL